MDRVAALAALDRKILLTYSARTSRALAEALPLRIAVPHIEAVLAFNVGKEIEKDALVIREAAGAVAAGAGVTPDTLRRLLESTREIDRAFLHRVGRLPVGIVIPYDDIEPVRLRRIERLYTAVQRVLAAWAPDSRVRDAMRMSYTQAEFEAWLCDWLRLYAVETQLLSRAVRLPALVVPLRERIAQGLFRIMQDTGAQLAHAAARMVYRH